MHTNDTVHIRGAIQSKFPFAWIYDSHTGLSVDADRGQLCDIMPHKYSVKMIVVNLSMFILRRHTLVLVGRSGCYDKSLR